MSERLARLARAGVTVAAIGLAVPAGAAPLGPAGQELDLKLQALKQEAVELNRDLLRLEQAALYPDPSRTTVYVSTKIAGFLLEQVSVRIDDGRPIRYDYTPSEARALLRDGWHRIARLSLAPGTYRLTAEFIGRFYDSNRNEGSVSGQLETVIEKGAAELDLVLPISRNTRLDRPGLAEISRLEPRARRPGRHVWLPAPERREAGVEGTELGGEDDPRYRAALFLRHDHRYFSALTELLEVLAEAPDPATLPGAFHQLLSECYLGFGIAQSAGRVLGSEVLKAATPADAARLKLDLARFEYERGHLPAAAEALAGMREQVPAALVEEWREMRVNVLLTQGRYSEALQLYSTAGDVEALSPILRYNLAVALVQDGRGAEGRRQLNQVGTLEASNPDALALRDKANLTLGYQFLQAQQGENARAVFGRIRTEGPFSNRALLGLGWAELAPRKPQADEPVEAQGRSTDNSLGTLLRPGFVDGQAKDQIGVGSGAGRGLSVQDRDSLLRALVPWVELIKRDPMDPAVQEGMLAIPWALDHLQAYEQSLKYYTDAIATLEEARKRIDEAIASIASARMVSNMIRRDPNSEAGWRWRLKELVDTPENYFLQNLVAEHRFQEALKNYRDARLLSRILDTWAQRVDDLQRGGGAGSGTLEQQVQRLRRGWQPPWSGQVIALRYDTGLAAPGAYAGGPPAGTAPPLDLVAAPAPEAFAGVPERLAPLRERLESLRARMSETGTAQARLLAQIASGELEGQKRQIERYLTEARFAVARIYDRQLRERR